MTDWQPCSPLGATFRAHDRPMTTMQGIIRSLGNDGARANARREIERRAHDDAVVAALAHHLPPVAEPRVARAA